MCKVLSFQRLRFLPAVVNVSKFCLKYTSLDRISLLITPQKKGVYQVPYLSPAPNILEKSKLVYFRPLK